MIASLLSDGALRERLHQDCSAHADNVIEALSAHAAGALDDTITLRTCALELHSLKGVASVLGMSSVLDIMGPLSEIMVRGEANVAASFWSAFGSWFVELAGLVGQYAAAPRDPRLYERLRTQRELLVTALGRSEPLAPAQKLPTTPTSLSSSAGRRLLLVDDSATVRAALSARLIDRGYPVRTAKTLTETARLLAEFDPEIVITDVCMPNVEGDELCRRIKAHMQRLVPVLLYSSLPEETLRERAIAAGADGYLCKYHGVDALIERLDALIAEEILF